RSVDLDPYARIGDRVGDVDHAVSEGEGPPHRREPEQVAALEGHGRSVDVDLIPAGMRDLEGVVGGVRRGHLNALRFVAAGIGYTCRSSVSFSRCAFLGSCRRACLRTTSGTSSLPIPCPSKSRVSVTSDRSPLPSGSIVPMAIPVTGMPPVPRKPQLCGGVSSATSSVVCTSRRPTRRVTVVVEPTASGASPSGLADTTLCCHSGKCDASVAYAKTSWGRRNISMLSTIAAISPPLSRSCAVSSWPFGCVLAHGLRRAPTPRRRSGPPPASRPGVTSAGFGSTLLC